MGFLLSSVNTKWKYPIVFIYSTFKIVRAIYEKSISERIVVVWVCVLDSRAASRRRTKSKWTRRIRHAIHFQNPYAYGIMFLFLTFLIPSSAIVLLRSTIWQNPHRITNTVCRLLFMQHSHMLCDSVFVCPFESAIAFLTIYINNRLLWVSWLFSDERKNGRWMRAADQWLWGSGKRKHHWSLMLLLLVLLCATAFISNHSQVLFKTRICVGLQYASTTHAPNSNILI